MSGVVEAREHGKDVAESSDAAGSLAVPLIRHRGLSLFCSQPPLGTAVEHSHGQLEIAVVFEPSLGSVSWPLADGGRKSEAVSGPEILIIAPRQPHAWTWEKSSDVIVVHLETRLQRQLLPKGMPEAVMAPAMLVQDGVLWQFVSGLRTLCIREAPCESLFLPMVAHCVAARVIELMNSAPAPALRRLTDAQLRAVQEFVRNQLSYGIHADDLAKCAGLSLQYFNALFKNTVGMTPAEYIFECRMQRAHELLGTGQHKIGAVARLVGFWDAGNFTGRFRMRFGVSPRALIDQARRVSSVRPNNSSERP